MDEPRYQSELLNVQEWRMLYQSYKGIENRQSYCKIEPRLIYDALVSLDKCRKIIGNNLGEARETIKAQKIVIDQLRAQLESRSRIIDGEELP